jgi:ADP-heptose:LPS heptosyltransferase
MDNILIMRGGAIGDFLLTLPVIAALKQNFPGAHIEILGYPRIAALAVAGGLADLVRSVESPTLAGFFAADADLDPDWLKFFSKFDLFVSFLHDPQRILETNIKRVSHGRYLCGPHRPDEKANLHATNVFLKPLETIGIHDADPVPHLRIPFSTEGLLSAGDWIALHPGSGSAQKNWPAERWIQLLERFLKTTHWRFLLVGGEAESDRLGTLFAQVTSERITPAQNLPLPLLAQRLSQCKLFLGHDSGISHLAAALGIPGMVLWGPTNSHIWRPRSQNFEVLSCETGLGDLSVDCVHDHFLKMWNGLAQKKTPSVSFA